MIDVVMNWFNNNFTVTIEYDTNRITEITLTFQFRIMGESMSKFILSSMIYLHQIHITWKVIERRIEVKLIPKVKNFDSWV